MKKIQKEIRNEKDEIRRVGKELKSHEKKDSKMMAKMKKK